MTAPDRSLTGSVARHPASGISSRRSHLSVVPASRPKNRLTEDEKKKRKRDYMAQRRKAGLETMQGRSTCPVKFGEDGIPTVTLSALQLAIVQALAKDGATTDTIAKRVGSTTETVRRNLRLINDSLGYTDRAELLSAVLRSDFRYVAR